MAYIPIPASEFHMKKFKYFDINGSKMGWTHAAAIIVQEM
jgi:hypothetical protein